MLNNFMELVPLSSAHYKIKESQNLDLLDLSEANNLLLNFVVDKNCEFMINLTSINHCHPKRNITINLYVNDENIDVVLKATILGLKNTNTTIEINVYSEKKVNSKVNISVNGIIDSNDATITAIPKFIFEHNNLNAKHGVVIGSVNFKELLYLMNRGIDEDQAKFLLISTSLFSCLNSLEETLRNQYQKKILNIWKDNTHA